MSVIKKLGDRITKSENIKNVATLATGTTLAQMVSIFTAPILYRIYSKVDYGTIGLYMAIVGVLGVFSTMQYVQPILLEKEDEEAKKVMWLNRIINLTVTVFITLLVLLFGEYFGQLLGNENILPWLYLAPISIFFTGQSEIFSIWANRKKKYKILTYNTILTAFLVPVISISFGLYNKGPLGLFLGLLISQVVPPIVLLLTLTKYDNLGLKYLDWVVIKRKLKEHKSFPIYSLPSEFINRFTNQLPVFMLSAYAGPAAVGVYNLCARMLSLPSMLISNAISTVYRQEIAAVYNILEDVRPIMLKTFKSLMFITLLPTITIILYGPELFSSIFGEEWIQSGQIAQILIFMFVLQMVVSPLTYIYYIRNKLKENMIAHLYILISNFLIFYVGFKTIDALNSVLILYVINNSAIYIYYFIRSYNLSKK